MTSEQEKTLVIRDVFARTDLTLEEKADKIKEWEIAGIHKQTDLTQEEKEEDASYVIRANPHELVVSSLWALMDHSEFGEDELRQSLADVSRTLVGSLKKGLSAEDSRQIWVHKISGFFRRSEWWGKCVPFMQDGAVQLVDEAVRRSLASGKLGQVEEIIDTIAKLNEKHIAANGPSEAFYFKPASLNNPDIIPLLDSSISRYSPEVIPFLTAQTPADFVQAYREPKSIVERIREPAEGEFYDCDGTLFPNNLPLIARLMTRLEFDEPSTVITYGHIGQATERLAAFGVNQIEIQSKDAFKDKNLDILYDDIPANRQGLAATVQKDPFDTNFIWTSPDMKEAYERNLQALTQRVYKTSKPDQAQHNDL